jgi:tetratricopeptide (TPR) repeat protein
MVSPSTRQMTWNFPGDVAITKPGRGNQLARPHIRQCRGAISVEVDIDRADRNDVVASATVGAGPDRIHAQVHIFPTNSVAVGNAAAAYAALNRLDEAKTVLDRGLAAGIAPEAFAGGFYMLAFLRKDAAEMQKQFALTMGKADYEDSMLSTQADTEAYFGRQKKAREYTHRAVEAAKRNGTMEVAAGWKVNGAVREALFGNMGEGKKEAMAAMQMALQGRYIPGIAAFVLAQAGDGAQAQKLADELAKKFPQDTILVSYWLPTVYANIALNRHDAQGALERLRQAQRYEMGSLSPYVAPLAVLYARGYAYLAAGQKGSQPGSFRGSWIIREFR